MDKSMIKGVVIGGVAMVVLAAGAVPTYKALTKPKFVEVTSVNEVTETIVTPREECNDVQVQRQAPAQDSNRVRLRTRASKKCFGRRRRSRGSCS
jgi:uncharacterized protein YcfJ